MAVQWRRLWVGGGFNPSVIAQAENARGAYAVREHDSHVVRYVGESSRGVLWKTMLRHFQAPESFAAQRETGIFTGDPKRYDVALLVTSRGPRPRAPAAGSKPSKRLASIRRRGVKHTTAADQKAMRAQAAWIARLKPTINVDDGKADVAEDFRAHRAKQEAEDASRGFFDNPGKRGQLLMVDPDAPKGALTVLGALACLVVVAKRKRLALRWSLKTAPLLAYDRAGRLFIAYRGKVEGRSTAAQRKEYERTHWGAVSGGKLLGGGLAVGPYREIGEVTEITYTTRKGDADGGKLVDWVHEFGEGSLRKLVRPRLVAHDCAKGRCGPRCAAKDALGLSGGSYRVTERGIVG